MHDLKNIVSNFRITGTYTNGAPYGSGHINDTFKIDTKEADQFNYILQRVNHHVFKDVPGLMENVLRVTQHIRKKLESVPGANPDRELRQFVVIPISLIFLRHSFFISLVFCFFLGIVTLWCFGLMFFSRN